MNETACTEYTLLIQADLDGELDAAASAALATHVATCPGCAALRERMAAQAGIDPKADDTLIGASELSRPRQYAATVNPNRQFKCLTILECKKFRGQFAGAIEG